MEIDFFLFRNGMLFLSFQQAQATATMSIKIIQGEVSVDPVYAEIL